MSTATGKQRSQFDVLPYGVYTATATVADEVGNTDTSSARYSLDGLPPYADVTDGEPLHQPRAVPRRLPGVARDVPYPAGGRTLHLHFETGSGLWEDGSQTGYTMQCSGATCPSTGVSGKAGTAVTFDGVDDLLDFAGNAAGPITTGAITTTVQLGLPTAASRSWPGSTPPTGAASHALLGSSHHDRRLLCGHPEWQPHPGLRRR